MDCFWTGFGILKEQGMHAFTNKAKEGIANKRTWFIFAFL
jgi:hypothetical protein